MESENPDRQMKPVQNKTEEDGLNSRRAYERKQFMQWAKNHHNSYWVKAIGFDGIVLASGCDERRYDPDGGFSMEDWPDLKAICGSEDDEVTHMDRDEIVGRMLERRLISQGNAVGSVLDAVRKFAEVQDAKYLWNVFEEVPFEELVAILSERVKELDETRRSHVVSTFEECDSTSDVSYSKVADGPRSPDAFWWRDVECRFSKKPFALLVALWNAPGKSLDMYDVLWMVWKVRTAAVNRSKVKMAIGCIFRLRKNIKKAGVKVKNERDRESGHLRVTLLIPAKPMNNE